MSVENVDNNASVENNAALIEEIINMKKERNAVILAHYYTRPEVQDVADYIGDSLALAQIAAKIDNPVIVMCGVHFMAETTKILCPDRKVLIPAPEAGCSLADSCPADEFADFVAAHPNHTVVSYVNTSAAVKAVTDVVVTSSNALKIVDSFPADTKFIFGPDRNLGHYISSVTGRDMLIWNGGCHVHSRFSFDAIVELKRQYPEAKVLVHPECPAPIQKIADVIASTAGLLKFAQQDTSNIFIVATESGILHEMQKKCPGKTFIPAPPEVTEGVGCSCNDCSYMKLITLEKLRNCLRDLSPQIEVDDAIAARAILPINRMLELS